MSQLVADRNRGRVRHGHGPPLWIPARTSPLRPSIHTVVQAFLWDRDIAFRQITLYYWAFIWAGWPAFGVVEMVSCFVRLL